jgi:HemY protein
VKRSLLVALGVIVLAGWLGTLISRDPGYVLVSYDGASLQTSLWVAVGLTAFVVGAAYYGLRLARFVIKSGGYWSDWREDRKRSRAHDLTAKGTRLLMEGDFERAERFLVSGAENNNTAAINFLAAARAADKLDEIERREAHLRRAKEVDASIGQAAALVSAEMSATRGEWSKCIQTLSSSKSNDVVLSLRQRALFELKDWSGLVLLFPALKKSLGKDSFLAFEKDVALARFTEAGISMKALHNIFKNLSADLKKDPTVVLAYCELVDNDNQREAILRKAIREDWHPALLDSYGSLGSATLTMRLKQAESWMKQHADDASLQLCLGRIYEAQGDFSKAREAYEKSIDLKNSMEANESLAGLLASEGDFARSHEHLKAALKLV